METACLMNMEPGNGFKRLNVRLLKIVFMVLINLYFPIYSGQDLAPCLSGCQRVIEPVSHLFFINQLLREAIDATNIK